MTRSQLHSWSLVVILNFYKKKRIFAQSAATMSGELEANRKRIEEDKDKIYKAVLNGDNKLLAELLRTATFDMINTEDSSKSVFDEAVAYGNYVTIELLLAHGAIPDYNRPKHAWMNSTLSFAIMSNNHKIIRLLVEHGCDPDTELDILNDKDKQNRLKIPQIIPYDYWYKIIEFNDLRLFQLFLECKNRKIINDEWSQKMMMLACCFGSCTIIKYLLEQGVSIEMTDENDWTCIFHAISWRRLSVVELLLPHVPNLNRKDLRCRSVLHTAILSQKDLSSYYTNRLKIIQLLISHGAYINATDEDGLTPINMALMDTLTEDDYPTINLLLRQPKIELAKPDINGVTVLHRAVSVKNSFLHKRVLFSLNVDINARDNMGKTPIQSVEYFRARNNILLLLEMGAESKDLDYYKKQKDNWFERRDFLKVLETYRLKRKFAGLSNDVYIDSVLSEDCVFYMRERREIVERLSADIEKMKNTILCDKTRITYYDFLHAKKRTLINIAKKPEMWNIFIQAKHGFYEYAFMLARNYLTGMRSLTLIESDAINAAEKNFHVLLNNKLPSLVAHNIKKYIDIEDMITLNNMNLIRINDNTDN